MAELGTVEFALLAIGSTIAVMEPASTKAVYVTLTKDMDSKKQRSIIAKSMRISFLVLAFFTLTGHLLFSVFNITVAAFKIAGGILLISVALQMLSPRKTGYFPEELEDIALVPLAFPLTAGPGTIATVTLLVSEAQGLLEVSFVFVAILAGIVFSYVGMVYGSRLSKLLGDEGLRVVTKLMSIIVLAIAVQFVINGVADAISQFFSE